jgi:predicted dehydrogenase
MTNPKTPSASSVPTSSTAAPATTSPCDCSRRTFLKGGLLATAVPAVAVSGFYAGYRLTHPTPLRVGVVGVGDQGQVLMSAINPKHIEVKSIADIRPYNLHRAFHGDISSPAALKARRGLLSVYGWNTIQQARKHVTVYNDYRELIKNAKKDGIEAIIIGLPLHLHAPAAVYAMKLGLHVLTEKLMGHSVANCKEMAQAAHEYEKHLATGHQRHYNILYQEAVDQIRRGLLGNIHYIRAQWHRNNAPGGDSWQLPMPLNVKPDDPQRDRLNNELAAWTRELNNARGLAIEEWAKKVALKQAQIDDHVLSHGGTYLDFNLKSAEEYGYEEETFKGSGKTFERPHAEELLRWRLWRRTGGGLMVELGSHQLDAATIFLSANQDYYLDQTNSDKPRGEKVIPFKVHVSANRNIFGLDREVSDHVTTLFEFPAPDYDERTEAGRKRKICVQYSTINGNGFGGYGEIVYGTDGTLMLTSETDSELFRGGGSSSSVAVRAAEAAALDTQDSGPAQMAIGGAKAEVSRGYTEELEHWAWCIRVNPRVKDKTLQPRCHPKIALADSVISLVSNIAADEGQSITFNPKWFDPFDPSTPETEILNDPEGKPSLHKAMYNFS